MHQRNTRQASGNCSLYYCIALKYIATKRYEFLKAHTGLPKNTSLQSCAGKNGKHIFCIDVSLQAKVISSVAPDKSLWPVIIFSASEKRNRTLASSTSQMSLRLTIPNYSIPYWPSTTKKIPMMRNEVRGAERKKTLAWKVGSSRLNKAQIAPTVCARLLE